MTTLLIVSLILHGVTFLWIFTLMLKLSARGSTEEMEGYKKEIEDTLIAYTIQMKEENERLLERLVKEKAAEPIGERKATSVSQEEPQVNNSRPVMKAIHRPTKPQTIDQEVSYAPPLVEDEGSVVVETSPTSKVIAMAKQGNDIETIARALKMGKGEVELLIKFYG